MRKTNAATTYNIVWDIGDQTHIKTYRSRWEAFNKFKELSHDGDVISVKMLKPNGYALHSYERP